MNLKLQYAEIAHCAEGLFGFNGSCCDGKLVSLTSQELCSKV